MAKLKSPKVLNALAMFVIGGGMCVAMTVHIQEKYHLYSSATTMILIQCVTAIVLFGVMVLVEKRWFIAAWIATLVAPPVLFVLILRYLAQHPPIPPIG